MYVRSARNREEAWLLDRIEELGLDEAGFRSRDYVVAVDERTDDRAGFGRLRVHTREDGDVCELTGIGVLPGWRDQGVGAHVVERLVERAGDEGFETVYSLTGDPAYLAQFGFESVDETALPDVLGERLDRERERLSDEVVPTRLDVDAFEMPDRLREAFKNAGERADDEASEERAEDFGIDPDEATYKYDTGS